LPLSPELPSEHPAAETLSLQETLGHTPHQVAVGALVGLVVTWMFLGLWQLVVPQQQFEAVGG